MVSLGARVVAYRAGQATAAEAEGAVLSLAVDAAGNLWLQLGSRVFRHGAGGPQAQRALVDGRLASSGVATFAELDEANRRLRVLAASGRAYDLATLGSLPRALSWGEHGPGMVVDDDLVVWRAGSPRMTVLLRDKGLGSARDVCLTREVVPVLAAHRAVERPVEKRRLARSRRCAPLLSLSTGC